MKKLSAFAFALIAFQFSFAQLVSSNDTTICAGKSAQLQTSGGSTYSWSPTTGLTGANTATPVATPTVTTTYVVTSPISNANIVVNGDFSQGNTGFTSEYTYETPTNINGSGSYFVGSNANTWNANMSSVCTDRNTDADANMLIVNGSLVAGTKVWCQTHTVNPNTTYNLSAWFQELHQQNYPILQWNVNGANIGSAVTAIVIQCIFREVQTNWNSGVNTQATFCLVGGNTAGNGNDYAIDQISITGSGNMYDTVVVNVQNAPTVNLGADTAICTGQSLVLDAGNSGAVYHWSDNSLAQTRTVTTPGNYPVTVTIGSCSASDAVDVAALILNVTTAAVNTTCGLDNGQASVIANNGTAPYTYIWNNTGNTDTIWNIGGGTYNVTVNDDAGCSATGSATVNTSGAGNVTITGGQAPICATDSVNICAPAGYMSYLWNNGALTECIHPSAAGNYYVTVTDNANCTSTSNHIAVSVYPVPSVSVSVSGDTLRAFNAAGYQWYFNGDEITNANTDTYIAAQAGSYTVQVSDANGCVALSNPLIITGLETLTGKDGMEVYPNPNKTGNWHLSVSNSLVGKEMEITDVNGKVVLRSSIRAVISTIETSFASGVYLLKVTAGPKTYLHKLIKL